ncbi:DNA-binding protein [Anaerospora hongkongensis]|uniref:DNA-binding protein n=1 Tax=Anaerospora hongkongensis TaxID=244830 RepID=UPI002FD9CE15
MEYITAQEAADKWGITRRRVQILCSEGRIDGAIKMANLWVIPKEAEKPEDARKYKTGVCYGENQ